MKSFFLRVSSPDGDIFSGDAVKLCVRGTEGDLAIMAGHIPFVSYLKPCECKIELTDGEEKIGHIDGGVLSVSKDTAVLLSGSFVMEKG